ncbi:peptidase domain-containing ABC transporter [Xenorhabdus innexi]|uniref:Putative microcin-H47 secretion/processing ATP-binding protein MchF n=1 Tax=Xenorhabdus innexi TaxID=290109 RepID=A0A1N6MX10_9GAMM|nr:peptidase domain-containing ABC transporter [Xenorhabdus innexi]PHM33536.1 RTX toxin [Xenorhabdus innexi]SIP73370.1 putative microcin-H47 secretion/processing ATP-binding protein MchF [Xenorhabdus innexi]
MNKTSFETITERLNLGFRRRVPKILQTEAAECGLASLAMVFHYHGLQIDLSSLRSQFGISTRGVTLTTLINIANTLKFKTRAVALDLHELQALKTPCILHWDMNHFVVLVNVKKNKITIHDPAFGQRIMAPAEVSKHFTGIALEVWPSSEFVPLKKQNKLRIISLLNNIQGIKSTLIKIFFLSLVIEAINILLPVGTQLIMDHVIIAQDHSLLTIICCGLLFFILFRVSVSTLRSWTSITMEAFVDVQWKSGVFDHLMKLPLAYFEKRKLGDIQSRFSSLNVIRTTFTQNIINSIIDTIMLISVFIMMLLYGDWLVWVVLAFTVIYIIIRFLTYQYYRQLSEEQIVKDARANSHFMETLYSINTLKALGLCDSRAKSWLNLNIDTLNSNTRLNKIGAIFNIINVFISTSEQIIILWLGASLVIDNHMTLGMFVAFNSYRGQFADRAGNLIDMAIKLRMLNLHNERIADIVLTETEKEVPDRDIGFSGKPVSLTVHDLYYQYDSLSKPIISGFSLNVNAGESVAIVGPSGAGKTTLMKLMSGLLEPDKGTILMNGIDINIIGLNNYRKCIACVLQDDKLLSGSIAENISGFIHSPDINFIQECAKRASIHDDILLMPMGYETLIGELGNGLSGGQIQRLLIARALYRRPSILFMDEATSHLDLNNESYINESISSLNITRIIIAHRTSTIQSAERVISISETS